jgi:hypothetical protein
MAAQFPSSQKFLGLLEREALFADRQNNIGSAEPHRRQL